jgi:hypothetical protein
MERKWSGVWSGVEASLLGFEEITLTQRISRLIAVWCDIFDSSSFLQAALLKVLTPPNCDE